MKRLPLVSAVGLCVCTSVFSSISHAASVSGQGTWETTLQARDLDGNPLTIEAYYDTALNITWLADANYAGGPMDWATAIGWAAGLNINNITGWRLPNADPIDGTTANDTNTSFIGTEDWGTNVSAPGSAYAGNTANEMAHMFYNTLGDTSTCGLSTSTVSTCGAPEIGWGLANSGPFSNLQPDFYWSANATDILGGGRAWCFHFNDGGTCPDDVGNSYYAWAVHSGDVGTAAVPLPAGVWLFGSGLFGLIGVARHRKAN
jgi:hypothetical protein